jgi:hypothetical protein
MSITAVNAVYEGAGPTATGQILAQSNMAGQASRMLPFTATATLDGSSTSFRINYIDGTATILTPKGIIACASGGPATAAAATVSVSSAVSHNASTGQDDYMTITISGADSNGHFLTVAGFILL